MRLSVTILRNLVIVKNHALTGLHATFGKQILNIIYIMWNHFTAYYFCTITEVVMFVKSCDYYFYKKKINNKNKKLQLWFWPVATFDSNVVCLKLGTRLILCQRKINYLGEHCEYTGEKEKKKRALCL